MSIIYLCGVLSFLILDISKGFNPLIPWSLAKEKLKNINSYFHAILQSKYKVFQKR